MDDQADGVHPPSRLRLRYYLFEVRLPPAFLTWAERDIASPAWLMREVMRLVVVFIVLTLLTGRFAPTLGGWIVLGVGAAVIVAAQRALRRIALAYQRYGWEWDEARTVGSPYLRVGLALVFSVVFVLLAR